MATVKETGDLITAAEAVKAFYNNYLTDGFQFTDFAGLLGLYPPLEQAISGISEVPNELADLDDAEIQQLTDALGDDLIQDEEWLHIFFGLLKVYKGINGLITRNQQPAA